MKKSPWILLMLLVFSAGLVQAQFVGPATQPDNPVVAPSLPAPSPNTSVALSSYDPGVHNYMILAYDDPGAPVHEVQWYNQSGAFLNSYVMPGADPDVGYYKNADLSCVISTDWSGGGVVLDVYYLNTIPSPHYVLGNTNPLSGGTYPNLDMNQKGDGAFAYEKGGMIILGAFTPGGGSSFIAPLQVVGPGIQPDVALSDNGKVVFLTYVQGGQLIIEWYDYSALQAGALVNIAGFNYPPIGQYQFPRIAAAKNAPFLSPMDYTVVAEDQGGAGSFIIGHTFIGGVPQPLYQVNPMLEPCSNRKPVVTYKEDQVIFAWSAEYSGCGFTPGPFRDVLTKELDVPSMTLWGGTNYREINQLPNDFYTGNAALASRNDKSWPYTNALDAATYGDYSTVYWKLRPAGGAWRQASDELAEETAWIELGANPVDAVIELTSSEAQTTDLNLVNTLGQQIALEGRVRRGADRMTIDVADLAAGIYILNATSDQKVETFKVIVQ
ncbi:T9SS type A sorting domain-containing protein [Pontibacter sp. G13]|uniref:T9SS type A sorting domain-containing protein n=1 Tax=Pontibacter sp. G13 TaxID=3074898 RepID=UPI00288A81FA|nr:T9SS type A sorting domain-containing protein [Pontibacter sp. G13]WNJ18633.1 T9SS type A sorting domain-containing protein [Pontibacter sp. G13]